MQLDIVRRVFIIVEVRKLSESTQHCVAPECNECSLPSIVTPMRDKSHLQRIVAVAFGSVIVVYLLLFITSGLAFGTVREHFLLLKVV